MKRQKNPSFRKKGPGRRPIHNKPGGRKPLGRGFKGVTFQPAPY